MDKNQKALAVGFKKAMSNIKKIKELGITPNMTNDEIDALVERLSEAKAIEENQHITKFLDGQQWYVENLVSFSKLGPEQQLIYEYDHALPEVVSKDEMIALLTEANLAAMPKDAEEESTEATAA